MMGTECSTLRSDSFVRRVCGVAFAGGATDVRNTIVPANKAAVATAAVDCTVMILNMVLSPSNVSRYTNPFKGRKFRFFAASQTIMHA
jgi:hypothetical protein